MRNFERRAFGFLFAFLIFLFLWDERSVIASGIQALATVPAGGTGLTTLTAHDVLIGAGTSPVNLAGPGTAGQCFLSNGAGADPTYQACPGSGGGGITVYSGVPGTLVANTYFLPVGGGVASSTTEANVDVEAPSAATITNFYVQLSAALGTGNSGVFTWRKAGVSQSVTCTISGASATTCNDLTHSFTVAQGDLIDIQLVTSGTLAVTPNIIMAAQFGTTGSNGTVNTGTANQMAFYAANGTAISGEGLTSGCNLIAGTTSFIGPTFRSVTIPSAGSFSWLTTQGTASEAATCTNALLLTAPQTVGQTLRVRGLALSPNTTLTVGMTCGAEARNFRNCGVVFRESATGKLEVLNVSFGNSTTNIQVERWTNPTTFSATQYPGGPVGQFGVLWLRIKITGGNLFFYILPDGVNQVQVYTEASNAFFTTAPDQWGYMCGSSTDAGSDACYATLYSFLQQ